MNSLKILIASSIASLCIATSALAQQSGAPAVAAPPPLPYGEPISYDAAKKAMAATEAEAQKEKMPEVIAIVDTGGTLGSGLTT